MSESIWSYYARAMIAHMLDPCADCHQLRTLIATAHPDADMGERFAILCETVIEDRPSHAADIETDFALQERPR